MFARHAEADDAIAAGIGGKVAADQAGIAGAEIEPEEQPCIFCGPLRDAERNAGLYRHRCHHGVDLLDRIHAVERQRNAAFDSLAPPARPVRPPCGVTGTLY